jgi:hypothetical protein
MTKQLRRSIRKEMSRIDQMIAAISKGEQPKCPRCPETNPPVLVEREKSLYCPVCLWGEGE